MKTQMPTPFMKARVSAAKMLLATLWIFLGCQNVRASMLFCSFRKLNIPLWEIPSSKFAYDASECAINSNSGSSL